MGAGAAAGGMAVANMMASYSQAQGIKAQGAYEAGQHEINAQLAELQATDTLKRGREAESQQRRQTKQMIGSQRAALASQGVDVDSGSAMDIQLDAAAMGELDAMTIRNNAFKQAFGYRVEAANSRWRADMTRAGANAAARNTLITGGLQAVESGLRNYAIFSDFQSKSTKGDGLNIDHKKARPYSGQSYTDFSRHA